MSSDSKEDASPRKKEFRCSLCRVTCLTDFSFISHNRGARHLKALRSYRGRDYDQKPLKKLTSLKDFINDPDRNEPLIGLQYVEEGGKIKGKRHYRCTLCEQDMAMQVMFDHLVGHKHRRSYLNKHFPLLIKGVQTPTVAVLKDLAKEVEEEEGLQTYATNVPIKLQPHAAKKRSKKSSEQFSPESDPLEPMLTNADDVLDNMENVLELTGSLFHPWEPVPVYEKNQDSSDSRSRSSSQDSDYSTKRRRDRSPSLHKRSEKSSKHRSSREHSSKRYRDRSPSLHKRSEKSSKYRSSRERERSSKRSRDRSPAQYKKHSSSREKDYTSKKNRDRSPHYRHHSSSREADYSSKRDRNRSPHRY